MRFEYFTKMAELVADDVRTIGGRGRGPWPGAALRRRDWRSTGSTSPSGGARSTASWVRTGPGSRPSSGCSARCCARTAEWPMWPDTTWPANPKRCGCASASPCRRPPSTTARPVASSSLSRAASTGWIVPDPEPARRGPRPGRHRRRHRSADRHLLGRDEAPARPGGRPDPQPRGAVPRRADHRAWTRRAEPPCGRRSVGSTPSSG